VALADERAQASARGCGTAVLTITALITGLMVLVGLFLPPFSLYDRLFGVRYTALDQPDSATASADDGLRVALVSGSPVDVSIGRVSLVTFAYGGEETSPWVEQARAELPRNLALLSDVYRVQYRQRNDAVLRFSLAEPSAAQPEVLDVYGYDQARGRWEFIPSRYNGRRFEATTTRKYDAVALFQAAPPAPRVVVQYDLNQLLTAEAAAVADIVAPAGLQPMLSGALTGSLAPGFDLSASYQVMPILRDFADPRALDMETVRAILATPALRREHARQIASLAAGGFDGVWIDYRGFSADQRDNFSAFMRELRAAVAPTGMLLGVVVPAPVNRYGEWDTGAYDWQQIGQYADFVQVNMPLEPLAYLPGEREFVRAMLTWAVREVDRTRLMLGMTARSIRELNGVFTSVGYDEGLAALGNVVVSAPQTEGGVVVPGSRIRARLDGRHALAGVDTRLNAPYVDYLNADGGRAARIWLMTGNALRWRLDAGAGFALAGTAFYDLLAPDLAEGVFSAIRDYRAQIPPAVSPTDLALRWRIEGTNGLLQEVITPLGQPLETVLNAPDGNYAINVAVVGIGEDVEESVRSGAVVALFEPTATPTPLPTATPTPLPTMTPTPAPIVATAVPAAPASGGGSWAAVRPGAGSIRVGQFEYGGHVSNASSAATISAMQRAGMTWLKVQVRYSPGADASAAANYINLAHQNGFKALIGTVGNPGDLANGGDGYVSGYVNWLATIASYGPDAIEVWNEPNLDREWPTGQISGAAYTNMLRLAYNAIKSRNPSVAVISAAPGPTGAEAAYPGRVMNDDRWLSEMVAAGGLNYTDCVGVHYNEGIVPPSVTSGDPRDNYYTRYLRTLLDRYWSITGGQKPLCFTELGYLTPEGYPPLDPYFAWASNVTVAQQAAWLAEAAALLSQSGRVRLMIVWNVDFTYYGADPMAGFAIIRPGGGCPACDALAAAR
jgi:hypothetical protein